MGKPLLQGHGLVAGASGKNPFRTRVTARTPFDGLGLALERTHFFQPGHRLAVNEDLKFEGPRTDRGRWALTGNVGAAIAMSP